MNFSENLSLFHVRNDNGDENVMMRIINIAVPVVI